MLKSVFQSRLAALGSLAILLAFVAPVSIEQMGPYGVAVAKTAHIGLFACLAWLWGRPGRAGNARPLRLWLLLLLLAGVIEGLQHWTGRNADWRDILWGGLGAGWFCFFRNLRPRLIPPVLLLCFLAVPFAWTGWHLHQETRAFPVLAHSAQSWARRGWKETGGSLVFEEAHFRFVPAAQAGSADYPGIFRRPHSADWRTARALTACVYWPHDKPAVFALRIDDRREQPAYEDRFQTEFAVTQGWNRISIPSGQFSKTSGGRPMNLEQVTRWGLFLVSDTDFDYFLFSTVQLLLVKDEL